MSTLLPQTPSTSQKLGKEKRERRKERKGKRGEERRGSITFALAALLAPPEASLALADAVQVGLVADGVLSARVGFLAAYVSAGH